jgi:phosphopentomutase
LFEQLKNADKVSAMYYGWEPLRDVSRPGSLKESGYTNAYSFEHTDAMLTEKALSYIKVAKPDFVFLYMVETDEKGGHDNGWMSAVYLDYINRAIGNVKRVIEETNGEYTVIVTADHGGHDRAHGSDMYEDMTIPMFFYGPQFLPGRELSGVSILDIAPTIADIIGVPPAKEWEGKSLISDVNE